MTKGQRDDIVLNDLFNKFSINTTANKTMQPDCRLIQANGDSLNNKVDIVSTNECNRITEAVESNLVSETNGKLSLQKLTNLPEKDIETCYSPLSIRRVRSYTVPLLQHIYEDTVLHTSNWVSPTVTRKEKRKVITKRKTNTAMTVEENFMTKSQNTKLLTDSYKSLSPVPNRKLSCPVTMETLIENDSDEEETRIYLTKQRSWSQ